jgi:streptogramin lyase
LWAENILSPTGLAIDKTGDVYVASMFGGEIIKIDAETGKQSQFLAENTPADVEISGRTLYATVDALGDPTAPPAGRIIEVGHR